MQKALIVEDVEETGEWLVRVLQVAWPGITPVLCNSCAMAMEQLQTQGRFNLILLDISLPDGSGLALLPDVLRCSPEAYVIITTIFDDDEHIFTALRQGAKGYLLKDSSEQVFIQKLRGILTGDPPLSPSIARRILLHFNRESDPTLPAQANSVPADMQTVQESSRVLSPREREVLTLVAKGLSRKEIARMLDLSVNTVARYIRDVYQKLDISSQAEAAVEACRMGLVNAGY
ncbi:MAG: response regulator transcription factor [Thiolinea sp.]